VEEGESGEDLGGGGRQGVGEDLVALDEAVVGKDPALLGEGWSRRHGGRHGGAGMEAVEERAHGWRGNDSS
jgi:hypothetical protein